MFCHRNDIEKVKSIIVIVNYVFNVSKMVAKIWNGSFVRAQYDPLLRACLRLPYIHSLISKTWGNDAWSCRLTLKKHSCDSVCVSHEWRTHVFNLHHIKPHQNNRYNLLKLYYFTITVTNVTFNQFRIKTFSLGW